MVGFLSAVTPAVPFCQALTAVPSLPLYARELLWLENVAKCFVAGSILDPVSSMALQRMCQCSKGRG